MPNKMSCEVCGQTANLKSCGQCLKVNYCSREHQIAHWQDHKVWCKNNTVIQYDQYQQSIPPPQQQQHQQLVNAPTESSMLLVNHQGYHQHQPNNTINPVIGNDTDYYQESPQQNQFTNNSVHLDVDQLGLDHHLMSSATTSTLSCFKNSSESIDQQTLCHNISNIQNCPPMETTTSPTYNNKMPSQTHQQMAPLASMQSKLRPSEPKMAKYMVPLQPTNPPQDSADVIFSNLETYCKIVLRDMNQYGFCVIDNFLQNGDLILGEVHKLYGKGLFRAGQVVNSKANSNAKLIRGDQIIWVEGNEPICSNIGFLIRILDSIVTRCNSVMAVGEFLKHQVLQRTKAMIACYPGNNAKYVRHIDNPNNDGRCITSIYYLNKDYLREVSTWVVALHHSYSPSQFPLQRDGGVLRLFPQMNDGIVAEIEPLFNRVIFFWSDRRNPHEVMPAQRERFAITVWYFDADERTKAIQKYKDNRMLTDIIRCH